MKLRGNSEKNNTLVYEKNGIKIQTQRMQITVSGGVRVNYIFYKILNTILLKCFKFINIKCIYLFIYFVS